MRSINRVTLVGNIGREPEAKYAQNGSAVTSFSVATTIRWNQDGEWKEKTEWHNIVAYGKIAETIASIASKGDKCFIEGKIQTRQWETKDGEKRYTTEIVANEFALLSTGKTAATTSSAPEDDDTPF